MKKCKHKSKVTKREKNAYPYGDNLKWSECKNCGKKFSLELDSGQERTLKTMRGSK